MKRRLRGALLGLLLPVGGCVVVPQTVTVGVITPTNDYFGTKEKTLFTVSTTYQLKPFMAPSPRK